MTLRILSIYFFSTGNLCLGAGAKCHGSSRHKERMLPEFFCWNIYTFCHSLWSLRSSHWVLLVPTSDPLNISDPIWGGTETLICFPWTTQNCEAAVRPQLRAGQVMDKRFTFFLYNMLRRETKVYTQLFLFYLRVFLLSTPEPPQGFDF